MRRPSFFARLAHDLTHRGPSAWALASVLLGFYFGLYLTAETKQLLTLLGVAAPDHAPAHLLELGADAPMHLRLPSPFALVAVLAVGALAGAIRALVDRDDEGAFTDAVRATALRFAAKVSALTAATLYTAHLFARVLEPAAHDGRHLLPSPGARWSTPALVLTLVPLALALVTAASHAWKRRAHRGPFLEALALPLTALAAMALVLLYGTHVVEPAAVPEGTRSLAAFARRLYLAFDSKWGLYGLLYTVAVLVGGVRVIGRYLHDRYQVVRTLVVMGVQVSFGFSVPVLLGLFRQPEYYLSYLWPLKIDAFYPDNILRDPTPFVLWSFVGSLVIAPLLGVFFGKRWYCSWVCGCGGLANTAGDPFRHLASKSERAWRFERVSIYTVLALAIVTTALVMLASWIGAQSAPTGIWWPGHGAVNEYHFDPVRSAAVVSWAARLRYWYGVAVVSVLSGAIGVGLYPLGGTRQWCRNFCPMAAMLGLVQKFGRYRIRVKADMCISCGLCSSSCEMGIDVRAYAQANESFTRAACVGCGLCAEACPRGVLKLEQRTHHDPQERRPQLVQIRLRRDA